MGFQPGQPPRLPGERHDEPVRESEHFSDRYYGREGGAYEFDARVGQWIDVLSELLLRVRADWHSIWTPSLGRDRAEPPPLPGDNASGRRVFVSCEMLSLAVIEYPDFTFREFDEMLNSSSKGQWLTNSRHWHGTYTVARPAQRKVTAEMKRARSPHAGNFTYPGHPKPPRRARG